MSSHAKNRHLAYLLLGSNKGRREEFLYEAKNRIAERCGLIIDSSNIYVTAPWGMESDNNFLNQVIVLETSLSPGDLMDRLLEIESELGRKRRDKMEDRTIDIDILFYDNLVLRENDLVIPHPRTHLRNFALAPMAEIAGNMVHPVQNKTIATLLEETPDDAEVSILDR